MQEEEKICQICSCPRQLNETNVPLILKETALASRVILQFKKQTLNCLKNIVENSIELCFLMDFKYVQMNQQANCQR